MRYNCVKRNENSNCYKDLICRMDALECEEIIDDDAANSNFPALLLFAI